ncbi:MAG: DUF2306 domain-containing protein [Cyclobacteriaceae bacterium]|nr:DUF2306 domain-containing protein [Cyclobacteriaceae bacterium]
MLLKRTVSLSQKFSFVVLALLAVPLAINALRYFNFDSKYGFLLIKQIAIESGWYLPAYYAHVLVAGVILLIGIFQLYPETRLRWPSLHRLLGKVYVFGVLIFSAPGGLVMSFFINRGPLVLSSFLLQCSLWFVFTYLAFVAIRKGSVEQHRNWMWRSMALTLAAITLRTYVFIASWSFDLSQPAAYAAIAWLSWVPNVLLCEGYIRYQRKGITGVKRM